MKLLILLGLLFTSSSRDSARSDIYLSGGYKSQGDVEFIVNYSRFIRSESLTVFDFYYAVNLNTLRRKEGKVSFTAKVEITGEKLSSPITTGWSQQTSKPINYSLDKFWAALAPGEYDVTFTIKDNNSRRVGKAKFRIVTLDVDTMLGLSDIELLLQLFPGEDSIFGRFGYIMIPNPSGIYGQGKDTLYFYAEIYNLARDTADYFVRYYILDEKGLPVKQSKPILRSKSELPLIREGLDISTLSDGRYKLMIQAVDLSTGRSYSREVDFYYVSGLVGEAKALESEYYYFIDYFATPEELKEFSSLSEEGKLLFLKKFWKKLDPSPNTEINEFFIEFVKRCKYADENFTLPGKPGRLTDRGRIYIKYGPPDERNRVTFELTSRNREHWIYYGKGVKEFVFVDIKNNGDYELIYSSVEDEPTRPDWMKYVSPSDLQRQSF
ncbi:MAG: GWxTD domain-containing protein [candidate division WOR-3 bacterium]